MKHSEKIKPCPFCGAKAEIYSDERPRILGGGQRQVVICSRCFGRAGNSDTKAGAIRMWNRRVNDGIS